MVARKILIGVLCSVWCYGPALAEVRPEDKNVEKTIATMIRRDPLMRHSRHINIKAHEGVVYLNGTVESLMDKMQAGLYAENVEGVNDVHNCLRVKFWWPWEDEACGNTCGDVFEQEKWY